MNREHGEKGSLLYLCRCLSRVAHLYLPNVSFECLHVVLFKLALYGYLCMGVSLSLHGVGLVCMKHSLSPFMFCMTCMKHSFLPLRNVWFPLQKLCMEPVGFCMSYICFV